MNGVSSEYFIPREGTDFSDLFRRVRMMPLYSFPHYKEFDFRVSEHRNRFFIHLDFDAFYAQVEQRDSPRLRGKPVSVGGTPDGKGIVMTASYEARALGIDTAMNVWQARKICPELISLPCYGQKYEVITQNLMDILRSIVPEDCIEQYSIDECFAELTPVARNFEQAHLVAAEIKRRIWESESLTCSLGLSYNKSYAKMATKFQKPDGLTVITPKDKQTIYSLPVTKLWGIGKRVERRLSLYNIFTIGDLANSNPGITKKEFGINGVVFRKMARGEDTSGIFRKSEHEKMLNHHHTLSANMFKEIEVKNEIRRIAEYVCRKLRDKELVAGHMYLSIRYDDLRYAGWDTRLKSHTNDDRDIFESALKLYRKLPKPTKSYQVRGVGISVFDLHTDNRSMNYELFNNKVFLPYYAIDKIKAKHGEHILRVGLNT